MTNPSNIYKYSIDNRMQNKQSQFPCFSKLTLTNLTNSLNKIKPKTKSKCYTSNANKKKMQPSSGLLSVQEPYYVDRFHTNLFAHECHDSECHACKHSKMNTASLLPTSPNAFLSRTQSKKCRTQRNSQLDTPSRTPTTTIQNSRCRQKTNKKPPPLQIKGISTLLKRRFEKTTKKNWADQGIIELCGKYIQFCFERDNQEQARNSQGQVRKSLQDDADKIAPFNFQKFMADSGFIKYALDLISAQNQLGKRESKPKKLSIRESTSNGKQKDVQVKKKATFFLQNQQIQQNKAFNSTIQICTSYLIDQNPTLSQQCKQKLDTIAILKNSQFSSSLQGFLQFYIRLSQSGTLTQKTIDKLQQAVTYIKQQIATQDSENKKKKSRLNSLLKTFKNAYQFIKKKVPSQEKIASISMKRFGNQSKNDRVKSVGRVKLRPREKEMKEDQDDEEMEMEMKIAMRNNRRISMAQAFFQNSERVILEENMEDQNGHFAFQSNIKEEDEITKTDNAKLEKRFTQKKMSTKKTFSLLPDVKFKRQQQMQQRRSSIRLNQRLHFRQKSRQTSSVQIPQTPPSLNPPSVAPQSPNNITYRKQRVKFSLPQRQLRQQIRDISKQKIKNQQKQKYKEHHKQINKVDFKKQTSLLLSSAVVRKAQKALQGLHLNRYVINDGDCLLVQKKKIRQLRLIIQLRIQNGEIAPEEVAQILQYLSIFEENYFLICNRTQDAYGQQFSDITNFDFRRLVNKKQLNNQLNFYYLNDDYHYGLAQEDELNIGLRIGKFDGSWQITAQNRIRKPRTIIQGIQNIMKKSSHLRVVGSDGDLMQTGMKSVSRSSLHGISKIIDSNIRASQGSRKYDPIVDHLLVTLND